MWANSSVLAAEPVRALRPARPQAVGILLVEDELSVRRGFAEWLRGLGYHVRAAVSGQQAINLAGSPGIHIILLDIMMPGPYDGLQAAQVIQQQFPDRVIIFVTAYNNEETRSRAEALGIRAVAWVDKPSDEHELSVLFEQIKMASREIENRKQVGRFLEAAKKEGVSPNTAVRLLRSWDMGLSLDIVQRLCNQLYLLPAREQMLRQIQEQLNQLRIVLAQPHNNIQDHQLAFGPVKINIIENLWDFFEDTDPEHQRILSELETAVRKLSSRDLNENHIDALEYVVRKLAQSKLDKDDVRSCRQILRYKGIDTRLDLGRHRRALLEIYLNEDETEEET